MEGGKERCGTGVGGRERGRGRNRICEEQWEGVVSVMEDEGGVVVVTTSDWRNVTSQWRIMTPSMTSRDKPATYHTLSLSLLLLCVCLWRGRRMSGGECVKCCGGVFTNVIGT